MLAALAVVVINIAPIQNIHLETDEGKEVFGQKVQVCSEALGRQWAIARSYEIALKEESEKLADLPKEHPDWLASAKKCDDIAALWQQATNEALPLLPKVQAGLQALQNPARVIELVQSHSSGQELAKEDADFLQFVSLICQ